MKGKILPFIIGLLVGAIIATGGFLIYQNNNKHEGPQGMNGGTPPQMMQGNPPSGEIPAQDGQTQNNQDTTNTTSNS